MSGRHRLNTLLAYFDNELKEYASSTKWLDFSMLRTCISKNHNIDFKKYSSLIAYLKRASVGYVGKKSDIFTKEQLIRFLREADDQLYLTSKVILIIGVYGGLRRQEIVDLTLECFRDLGDSF